MLWMMKMVMGLGRRFENGEMGDYRYVVRVAEETSIKSAARSVATTTGRRER